MSVGADIAVAGNCDVIFLCVGTPTVEGAIDLSQVLAAAGALAPCLVGHGGFPIVVVKSTVLPGTTSGPVRDILERASGRRANADFGLAMNPEFLREGSAVADFRDPDRILLGSDSPRALAVLRELYRPYTCPVLEMSPSNAEMSKYANNALLATLVSFANDLATLCESLDGPDIETVMDSVALDRRLTPDVDGTRIIPGILSYLRAGVGFGGSCLPKDVTALARLAAANGRTSAMLDAVLTTNRNRPLEMLRLAEAPMGGFDGRRVALLGLAFKPGTDDTRQSVSFTIAEGLSKAGADVVAFDPLVRSLAPDQRNWLELAPTLEAALTDADAAFIVTAWPEFASFDWALAVDLMRRPIIVDGRGLLNRRDLPTTMTYVRIGSQQDRPPPRHPQFDPG